MPFAAEHCLKHIIVQSWLSKKAISSADIKIAVNEVYASRDALAQCAVAMHWPHIIQE